MIKYYIFALFVAVAMLFISTPFADAKNDVMTPATHLWLRAGTSMVYAPVSSLKQCEIMAKQAGALNSSEVNCYNGTILLQTYDCVKPVRRGEESKCS